MHVPIYHKQNQQESQPPPWVLLWEKLEKCTRGMYESSIHLLFKIDNGIRCNNMEPIYKRGYRLT